MYSVNDTGTSRGSRQPVGSSPLLWQRGQGQDPTLTSHPKFPPPFPGPHLLPSLWEVVSSPRCWLRWARKQEVFLKLALLSPTAHGLRRPRRGPKPCSWLGSRPAQLSWSPSVEPLCLLTLPRGLAVTVPNPSCSFSWPHHLPWPNPHALPSSVHRHLLPGGVWTCSCPSPSTPHPREPLPVALKTAGPYMPLQVPGAVACRWEGTPARLEHLWFWPGLKEGRVTPEFPCLMNQAVSLPGQGRGWGRVMPVPGLRMVLPLSLPTVCPAARLARRVPAHTLGHLHISVSAVLCDWAEALGWASPGSSACWGAPPAPPP
ncbi:uncharacterized protein LOC123777943 [Ursus americanus]|uniref:uncharacterized protein LOC123777943 n=1 Tax=Ursus americanus TaxID=9643 RepID=UPI001E67C271|nr:uncharacterized protein LOC123777943 [Ursus americanus]